jgi:hypothetical protein
MNSKFLVVLVGLTLLLSASAFAGTSTPVYENVAWEFTSVGNSANFDNFTFGEVFAPTQNMTVDILGYFGTVGGFTSDHPVGIFDANGNLLVSTVINNSSSLFSNHFVFNGVTPTALFAGQTYIIEGVSGTDPYAWNNPGFKVNVPITILGNNWVPENGLTFNGLGLINDVNDGYWGADFGIPEPGSLAIVGSSLAILGGLLRRKINVKALIGRS